jgi:glycosyltransferase involved in cell wall biosynthesis
MGHEVFVVTKRVDAWSDARDQHLLKRKRWKCLRTNLLRDNKYGRRQWLLTAIRSKIALRTYAVLPGLVLAEEAYCRGLSQVLAMAYSTGADFYIAHTQGALPVAARAALRRGVPYGFDCEDLLAEEASDGLQNPCLRRAILQIENAYLPRASYITATSRSMATFLSENYQVDMPRVIHNVFSREELRGVAPPTQRTPNETVEMVWMSATVGPHRGLEDAIAALSCLPEYVRLTIFGRMLPSYAPVFAALLRDRKLNNRVTLKSIPEPDQIMPTLASYDIGLTVDPNDCLNRSLTICNKVFLYLQSGLMIVATDTPGQREIVDDVPGCAVLYPPGSSDILAGRILPYVRDVRLLLGAKAKSWQAGQLRYNWDVEQAEFLAALESATAAMPRVQNMVAV